MISVKLFIPVELPVLVNEVAGETHEGVARAGGPHVGGEPHSGQVSFHTGDY